MRNGNLDESTTSNRLDTIQTAILKGERVGEVFQIFAAIILT